MSLMLILLSLLAGKGTAFVPRLVSPPFVPRVWTVAGTRSCAYTVHKWTSPVLLSSTINDYSILGDDDGKQDATFLSDYSILDDDEDKTTKVGAPPTSWLHALSLLPKGVIWSVPVGLAATLTYTGYTGKSIGFRYVATSGGCVYTKSFSTTIDGDKNEGIKGGNDVSKKAASYVMISTEKDMPDINLSLSDFHMGDGVMVERLQSATPGINRSIAADVIESSTPRLSTGMTSEMHMKVTRFMDSLDEHKKHCGRNILRGSGDAEELTKQINTVLQKGSMHIQQVKNSKPSLAFEDAGLADEAVERVEQASIYLTEFTRHFLQNMVELKSMKSINIDGEFIELSNNPDNYVNDYAKVGFPTFTAFVSLLPIGFLSVVSSQNFSRTISSTTVTSTLISQVVSSLAIVNNPDFEKEAVAKLQGTLSNLIEVVAENRSDNLETRLFTVTPYTEIRNGATIVTMKLTELYLKASTWATVYGICNSTYKDKGALLEYKVREISLECNNDLLESASKMIEQQLKGVIDAYNASDIPEKIDYDGL